jgi:hypothetical protein
MKYLTTKFGAFGAGLIGGLLVTFLFLSVTLAAGENRPNDIGREMPGFINNGRPAAQSNSRIAGPPPLALRLSAGQNPSPDNNNYLPLIIKGQ